MQDLELASNPHRAKNMLNYMPGVLRVSLAYSQAMNPEELCQLHEMLDRIQLINLGWQDLDLR